MVAETFTTPPNVGNNLITVQPASGPPGNGQLMTRRTVRSPGGDEVTIYTDSEWLTKTGLPKHALMATTSRIAILTALWEHGQFTDKSGRASRPVIEAAQRHGYKPTEAGAYLSVINAPVFAPCIRREMNGKRTFKVQLVALPESWLAQMPKINGTKVHPAVPERDATEEGTGAGSVQGEALLPPPPTDPVPATEPVEEPALEIQVANAVATALLTQVIEILSAKPADVVGPQMLELQKDLAVAQSRLAQRLEENEKLRRVLRQTQDELAAAHYERDGLRQRLRAAEHNLEQAMKGDRNQVVMAEVHREIDKMMRAKPGTVKGPD